VLPWRARRLGGVQLCASRHVASGLVTLSLLEGTGHPAQRAVLPRSARVVDEATAKAAEELARHAAAAAAAAGRELRLDLDEIVERTQRAANSPP